MNVITLALILAFQLAGVWRGLPAAHRANLAAAATGVTAPTTTAPNPKAAAAATALPVQTGSEPLSVTAASAYAIDTTTDTVLYAQNAGAQRPIASLTKLVTALVILSRHTPGQTVTIPGLPTYDPADATAGLRAGETYSVSDLVRALLIPSADDAADALAIWDAGSSTKFAAEMNAKLTRWGITGAHFSNPSGLQDAGNGASAVALGKIALLALRNPFIAETADTASTTIKSGSGRIISLTSTDDLLATGNYYGIKTGYTPAAGECFVGLTRINGHDVVTVVLGADDRFGATQSLTNWISRNWQWL